MISSTEKMKWNQIKIDNNNLTSEGLIAIEECTDYNITSLKSDSRKSSKRKVETGTNPKKTKRKVTSSKISVLKPSNCGSSCESSVQMKEVDRIGEVSMWSKFGLPECMIKALLLKGFTEPTPIQAMTLPAAVLGHKDIVGAAETGSGKTLAFGLPMLTGILHEKRNLEKSACKPLYGLVLTPTRELAMQVKDHLEVVAKFTDINIAVVVGGMATVKQERILNKSPEIVVATPGRLWELIQEGNSHLSQINSIRYLAIDETDRMLEKGHFEELYSILERINLDKTKTQHRQNFVFSATLAQVHELPKYVRQKSKKNKMVPEQKIQKIIKTLGMKNPKIVDITTKEAVPESLTECRISCGFEEKDYYIYYFLQKHPGRTLIFCNSIGCVKRLTNLLSVLHCHPLPLHASMQQKQRLKNLERFKEREDGVLIATDVAARGLDISDVNHVIHYQTPKTSESYVHRSGRTARVSKSGLTVVLVEPAEVHNYFKLRKTLNKTEDLPSFPIQQEFLDAVKEKVNLAREVDKLELQIRKENSEDGWLQKAAREMDIVVDDFCKKYDGDAALHKKVVDVKRKQLMRLLGKPVFPKGFSGKHPSQLGDFFTSLGPVIDVGTKKHKKHKK